ncbi:MAG TPA: peptidoglycan-binding domain-containing protein [Bryobacteraceae bacterium]|nr:peptidoglycan-binding domain-containing protein [Bryobacteraceae bacterium]
MNRVSGLVFLVILSIAAVYASPSSKKKTIHKPGASSTHPAKSTASSHAVEHHVSSKIPAKSVSTHSASLRTTHGEVANAKSSRRRRWVARAATPSFQTHPDEGRYRQIQQALADKGYFKGEVNGEWGQDSVDALQKFQLDNKFPDIYSDGKINALSLNGLGLGAKHGSRIGDAVPTPPIPTEPTTLAPAASSSSPAPDLPAPQFN